MSDKPVTDDGRTHWHDCWREHLDCAVAMVERALAELAAAEAELARVREDAEELRAWLDNNTTFHNRDGKPSVLAEITRRVWYHATDDTTSYPFTAVIDAAIAEKGKP